MGDGLLLLSIFNAYNATSDSKHCYMGLEECIDPPPNLNLEPFQLCACRIFNFIGLYRSHNIEKSLVDFCFHQWQNFSHITSVQKLDLKLQETAFTNECKIYLWYFSHAFKKKSSNKMEKNTSGINRCNSTLCTKPWAGLSSKNCTNC